MIIYNLDTKWGLEMAKRSSSRLKYILKDGWLGWMSGTLVIKTKKYK